MDTNQQRASRSTPQRPGPCHSCKLSLRPIFRPSTTANHPLPCLFLAPTTLLRQTRGQIPYLVPKVSNATLTVLIIRPTTTLVRDPSQHSPPSPSSSSPSPTAQSPNRVTHLPRPLKSSDPSPNLHRSRASETCNLSRATPQPSKPWLAPPVPLKVKEMLGIAAEASRESSTIGSHKLTIRLLIRR